MRGWKARGIGLGYITGIKKKKDEKETEEQRHSMARFAQLIEKI